MEQQTQALHQETANDYAYSANVEEFWRLVARIPHLKDVEERQRNLDHLDKLNAELEAMKR